MDSFLLAYVSLAASRNLLQQLIACLGFTLGSEDVFCWYKVISKNYGRSKCSWKPWRWVKLDLTLKMRNIYINSNVYPLTKFTSSSKSTEFKDILPWNISQIIIKTVPISTSVVISYAIKRGIPLWVWREVNGNWGKQHDQNFPMEGKPL